MKKSELHAAVWSRPISTVAVELGVSDTWLRKLCHAHGVPVPPRGYWQKLKANHHMPNPPVAAGEDLEVVLTRLPKTAKHPTTARSSPADSNQASVPASSETHQLKLGFPATDLELEMTLLERDAEESLRHRSRLDILTVLAARLAGAADLDPQEWRDWWIAMRSEVQSRAPRSNIEAWAKERFGAVRRRLR